MFNFATLSIINKATRITQHRATAIDYIHINSVLNTKTQTGIIKTDISANFPIFFVTKWWIALDDVETKACFWVRFLGNIQKEV